MFTHAHHYIHAHTNIFNMLSDKCFVFYNKNSIGLSTISRTCCDVKIIFLSCKCSRTSRICSACRQMLCLVLFLPQGPKKEILQNLALKRSYQTCDGTRFPWSLGPRHFSKWLFIYFFSLLSSNKTFQHNNKKMSFMIKVLFFLFLSKKKKM